MARRSRLSTWQTFPSTASGSPSPPPPPSCSGTDRHGAAGPDRELVSSPRLGAGDHHHPLPCLWLTVFFLVPFVTVLAMSFATRTPTAPPFGFGSDYPLLDTEAYPRLGRAPVPARPAAHALRLARRARRGPRPQGGAMNRRPVFLITVMCVGFAFFYVPILSMIVFSFNDSRLTTVWGGFSTRWYGALLDSDQIIDAALLLLRIAALSATLATILGTMGQHRARPLPPLPRPHAALGPRHSTARHARAHHRHRLALGLHPDGEVDRQARQSRRHHDHARPCHLLDGLRDHGRPQPDDRGRYRDRGSRPRLRRSALAGPARRHPAGHRAGDRRGVASGLDHLARRWGDLELCHRPRATRPCRS